MLQLRYAVTLSDNVLSSLAVDSLRNEVFKRYKSRNSHDISKGSLAEWGACWEACDCLSVPSPLSSVSLYAGKAGRLC